MIPGYNHNIKYKGTVYHVQTEDNGSNHAYIITHVFIGGNIIASKKVSYLDIAVNENAPEIIKDMMKAQHKAMVKDLIGGKFDDKLPGATPKEEPVDPNHIEVIPEAIGQTPVVATPTKDDPENGRSLDEIILDFLAKGDGDS